MRLQLTFLSVCFLLEGCVSLSDQCVQGVVTDASMNTVSVQSQIRCHLARLTQIKAAYRV